MSDLSQSLARMCLCLGGLAMATNSQPVSQSDSQTASKPDSHALLFKDDSRSHQLLEVRQTQAHVAAAEYGNAKRLPVCLASRDYNAARLQFGQRLSEFIIWIRLVRLNSIRMSKAASSAPAAE